MSASIDIQRAAPVEAPAPVPATTRTYHRFCVQCGKHILMAFKPSTNLIRCACSRPVDTDGFNMRGETMYMRQTRIMALESLDNFDDMKLDEIEPLVSVILRETAIAPAREPWQLAQRESMRLRHQALVESGKIGPHTQWRKVNGKRR